MAEIGKHNKLTVIRNAPCGVYLDGDQHGEILLPNRYVPQRRLMRGDRMEVFVYRDSEDRLVATTEVPRATVGDLVALRVVSVNPRVGAFLDWGLAKDLLLPFREQTGEVRPGDQVTVRIYIDPRTERIVASMKLAGGTQEPPARQYVGGEQVEIVIKEVTDLGYKALVESTHMGLLYHDALPSRLTVGQRLKGFVRGVRPDGKLDLSLQESGYKRVLPLTQKVIKALEQAGGKLPLDDDSTPDKIQERFGVSKKAFKQALGALYKMRRIRFNHPGIELSKDSEWSPGSESAKAIRKNTGAQGTPSRISTSNEQKNAYPKDHQQTKRQHGTAGESRARFPRRSHSREQQGRE